MFLIVIIASVISQTFAAGANTQIIGHVTDSALQEIFKRLGSLEINLKRQADNNAVLEKTVADLQEENKRLKDQINELQARDTDMNNAMNDLQNKIDAILLKRDDEIQYDIENTEQSKYKEKTDRNGNRIRGLAMSQTAHQAQGASAIRRDERHLQRRENEMTVAFFATLGNHLQHLGSNQNIAFDRVITNIGNGYNNHAGDFRAPVAGTYVFSVTLMAYGSYTTHYNIVKNSTAVANIYVRGTESPYASSSMTAVLQLQKGEDVSIRNVDADKMLHGSSYSAFSGFLLDQDFSSSAIVGK